MKISIGLILFLLGLAPALHGDDATLVIPTPMEEASYSAGVFSAEDELIRTLAAAVPEAEMPKAKNGLVLSWNGLDAYGDPAQNGRYPVEALAIPKLQVDGVRYLFNDWIADSAELKVIRPTAGFHRGDGKTAAVLELDENKQALAWFDADGQHTGTAMLPDDLPLGVASSDGDHVYLGGVPSIYVVPWDANDIGQTVDSEAAAMALDWNGSEFAVLRPDGTAGVMNRSGEIQAAGLGKLESVTRFTKAGDRWLALKSDGSVSEWSNDSWEPLAIPEIEKIDWITAGKDSGTFWVLGRESDNDAVAAQFGSDKDPLRTLALPNGFQGHYLSQLTSNSLLLIEQRAAGTEFRALTLDRMEPLDEAKENAPVSVWKETFVRKVDDPSNYVVENGMPVPASTAGSAPPAAEVILQQNPLSGEEKAKLLVSAALTPNGVWLSSSDGLLITRISSEDNAQWGFVTTGDKPGEVRLFEGLTWGIAEYVIQGVDAVISVDAGAITIPDDLQPSAEAETTPAPGTEQIEPDETPLPASTPVEIDPTPIPSPSASPFPEEAPPEG